MLALVYKMEQYGEFLLNNVMVLYLVDIPSTNIEKVAI